MSGGLRLGTTGSDLLNDPLLLWDWASQRGFMQAFCLLEREEKIFLQIELLIKNGKNIKWPQSISQLQVDPLMFKMQ